MTLPMIADQPALAKIEYTKIWNLVMLFNEPHKYNRALDTFTRWFGARSVVGQSRGRAGQVYVFVREDGPLGYLRKEVVKKTLIEMAHKEF